MQGCAAQRDRGKDRKDLNRRGIGEGKGRACCFLVMRRSISSTSTTVTRFGAEPAPENMASSCSAAVAGDACFPVSACASTARVLNQRIQSRSTAAACGVLDP